MCKTPTWNTNKLWILIKLFLHLNVLNENSSQKCGVKMKSKANVQFSSRHDSCAGLASAQLFKSENLKPVCILWYARLWGAVTRWWVCASLCQGDQLRREGPVPLQRVRLLQVRQVWVHPDRGALLRSRPDRGRGRPQEGEGREG